MGLGDLHTFRELARALALVGVLLFTALVPGHVVSQAAALVGGDTDEIVVEMSCHRGMAMPATMPDPDETPPPQENNPQEKCPFCNGYAAFMSALAGAPDVGELDAERVRMAVVSIDDVIENIAKHTKNRGPPLFL